GVLLAVPADVLACYADTGRFTMECVQRREVFKDDVSDFGSQELTRHTAIFEKSIDFAEDPWRTVCAATDHHRCCAREFTHTLRFFSAVNISVRKHGNLRFGRNIADRVVLGLTIVKIRTRAPMHRNGAYARLCCDA